MDIEAVPPSVRRAPPEVLEVQKAIDDFHLEDTGFYGGDDDDDAAPPPISRLRTPSPGASYWNNVFRSPATSPHQSQRSLHTSPAPSPHVASPSRTVVSPYPQYNGSGPLQKMDKPRASVPIRTSPLRINTSPTSASDNQVPPVPNKSPLRSHFGPEALEPSQRSHVRNYSHPFKKQPVLQSQPKYVNTSSFRNPPRPLSYRNSPRAPFTLRRWNSLETIDSIRTTQEPSEESLLDGTESVRTSTSSSSKRQYLSFYDDEEEDSASEDTPNNYPASSVPLPRTPSDHSRPESSASGSVQSGSTTTQGSSSKKSTAASILRKWKGDKTPEPLLSPESLEVDKRISLDQQPRTKSSTSSMTISSGRPSEFAFRGSPSGSTSQLSVSSNLWTSSDFDISGLTEAELKKCKKKGINPALYAEMKAARKGRFVSPIGGNTFI